MLLSQHLERMKMEVHPAKQTPKEIYSSPPRTTILATILYSTRTQAQGQGEETQPHHPKESASWLGVVVHTCNPSTH
jgi:hypothetical protein